MTALPDDRLLLIVVHDAWAWANHRRPTHVRATAAGWRVVVAAFGTEGPAGMNSTDGMADCVRDGGGQDTSPVPITFLPGARGATSVIELVRVVRAIRELVRTHEPASVEFLTVKPAVLGAIALIGRRPRPRVTVTFAGLGTFLDRELSRNGPAGPVARLRRGGIRLALRWTLSQCDAVLVENADDASALIDAHVIGPERVTVGPGVGLGQEWFERVKAIPRDVDARTPSSVVRAAQIGRVIGSKGVLDLLAAMRFLRDRGVAVDLVLAGALDDRNSTAIPLAQVCEWEEVGLCRWIGHLNGDEAIADLIRTVDIVVLASHREGSPRSLMEAQALGVPVIACDVAGSRQVVLHEKSGLLVAAHDAEALAFAIETLASDPGRRRAMAAAAQAHAHDRFHADRFAELWSAVVLGL